MKTVTNVHVVGMTCGHCVSSVRAEIEQIDGVSSAAVDLDSGMVEITSEGPVDPALVAAAVDEAGYEVAP